ncbi:MAG: sel1 repeat family protein [Campylobacteraceae bacterium]|nr:sel1 repeat family protein [Campylobacteraceae bacterium]
MTKKIIKPLRDTLQKLAKQIIARRVGRWDHFITTVKGVKKDHIKASNFLIKACELDSPEGCNSIAVMYYNPVGLKQDYSKAFTYFSKACTLGYGKSCYMLGNMYVNGRGVKKNSAKAFEFYVKGCDKKVELSCFMAGSAYADGDGVKRNYQKAIEYHNKACDKKLAESCLAIATLYLEKDQSKAFEYSKKACSYGSQEACFMGEEIVKIDKAASAAAKESAENLFTVFLQSCEDSNLNIACRFVAEAYEAGDGVAKDAKKAKYYYKKACDLGYKESCGK